MRGVGSAGEGEGKESRGRCWARKDTESKVSAGGGREDRVGERRAGKVMGD